YKEYNPKGCCLGDTLGMAVTRLLEFSQPYPGDEQLCLTSEKLNHRQFRIEQCSTESYIVRDGYFGKDVVLPTKYLCMPQFALAGWYAHH
ncbi:hypothetical protein B0H17DRAFT_905182, partial [Mycena rosella]